MPAPARQAVEARFGPVSGVEPGPAGLTIGVASRLITATGSVWLKAIPLRSPVVSHYRTEVAVGQALPAGVPAPRLLWHAETSGWLLAAFEFILDGRDADLRPGLDDLDSVLATMSTVAATLTPSPWRTAPDIAERLAAMAATARTAAVQPPADLPAVADLRHWLDRLDLSATTGRTLLHGDVHAGNLYVTPSSVLLVDWSLAARGAPWLDLVRLVPRLIMSGHTPADAEATVGSHSLWQAAPPTAVTGIAALWTLFAAHMAHQGPQRLHKHRLQSMTAGYAWFRHRCTDG